MPDLLFRNRVYDLAGIFNFGSESGNGMLGFYTNLPGSRMTELASCWESMEAHFRGSIDEFTASLKETG